MWRFCVETDYRNHQVSDFSSQLNRGQVNNNLFILNHFLTSAPFSFDDEGLSAQANDGSVLRTRVQSVLQKTQRIPNFIVVDFYDNGDVLKVAAEINDSVP